MWPSGCAVSDHWSVFIVDRAEAPIPGAATTARTLSGVISGRVGCAIGRHAVQSEAFYDPRRPMPTCGLTEQQRAMHPWGLDPALLTPRKVTTDPVHGDIHTTVLEQAIIDTPPFQRLRRVRQLGATHEVYPGATHTRFSHSLGALRVVQDLLDGVMSQHEGRHPVPDRIREWLDADPLQAGRDIAQAVVLARLGALLHDLCHVPFGHSIEDDLGQCSSRTTRTGRASDACGASCATRCRAGCGTTCHRMPTPPVGWRHSARCSRTDGELRGAFLPADHQQGRARQAAQGRRRDALSLRSRPCRQHDLRRPARRPAARPPVHGPACGARASVHVGVLHRARAPRALQRAGCPEHHAGRLRADRRHLRAAQGAALPLRAPPSARSTTTRS